MRLLKYLILAVAASLLVSTISAVDFGLDVSFDKDGLDEFHLAIGEHFKVEKKEVVVIREKKVPDEELPVVFFIARKAGVKPGAIIAMRLGGKSWMDIAFHFGLTAESFYVQLDNPGPPYGKAHGHFKKKKRAQWREIRLSDVEVVSYVNLRFLSSYYACSPDEIAKMRSADKNFVEINRAIKDKSKNKKAKSVASDTPSTKKSKGKSKKK